MKIAEAIELYYDKIDDVDKRKNFAGVIRHQQWDVDKEITDYLDFVKERTDEWGANLLPGCKKVNTKRKIQAALNCFLKFEEVTREFEGVYISSVAKAVSEYIKKIKGAEREQDRESEATGSIHGGGGDGDGDVESVVGDIDIGGPTMDVLMNSIKMWKEKYDALLVKYRMVCDVVMEVAKKTHGDDSAFIKMIAMGIEVEMDVD